MNGKRKVIGFGFDSSQKSIAIMDDRVKHPTRIAQCRGGLPSGVSKPDGLPRHTCESVDSKFYLYGVISLIVKIAFLKLEHVIVTLLIVGLSLCCHGGAYYTYGDFRYWISVYDNTGAPVSAKVFSYVGSKTASEIIIPASIVYEYDTTEYYVDANNKSQSRTVHKVVDVPVIGGNDQLSLSQVSAYQNNTTLRSVKIYGALDESPDCARCVNLTSVLLPDSITEMNLGFRGCSNLSDINLPKNLTVIGAEVFSGCKNLEEITLPENLTSIGCSAFNSCRKLKKITLPDKLTSIDSSTFRYCTALEKIDIHDNITYVGGRAFADCSALREISWPENILLGSGAFEWCTSLEELTLPGGVIMEEPLDGGGGQFAWCTNLTSVVLEEGMEALSPSCFEGCCDIKTISIPSTLTNINVTSFMGCVSLENVDIASDNAIYTLHNGFILNKKTMVPIAGPGNRENVIVPDGVTNILYSLYGSYGNPTYRKMKRLILPESLTDMSSEAFHGAINLEELFFQGVPPDCAGDLRPIFEVKGGGSMRVLNVMGYYTPKYRDEWRQVIDENGCWCGLKMEEGRPLYAVTYNVNGGNGFVDNQFPDFGGEGVAANDGSSLHWENHVFIGWALASDGEVVYKGGDTIAEPTDGDTLTLYAVWKQAIPTLIAENADWKSGAITLRCVDATAASDATHKYSLEYCNENNAWVAVDGGAANNVLGDLNGCVHLTDNAFSLRLGGIPPVAYRVRDENGRVSEPCVTRNRHALFVAIDTYADASYNLTMPTHEASVFRGSYKKYTGINGYLCTLANKGATKEAIIRQLDNIASNYAKPGDIVLFYHVGHGLNGGLLCHDKNRILWAQELSEKFDRFTEGVGIVAVIYACYSASMIENSEDNGKAQIGWLASSQSDQTSQSGTFTDVICNKGWLNGEADKVGSNIFANGDGVVTFAELASYGQQEMGNNFEQYERMMSYRNSQILEHIIAGKVPGKSRADGLWSWLTTKQSFLSASDGDVAEAVAMTAANGTRTVGQCFDLGIDPEDPNDDLKIADFKMEDGKPVITLNHTKDGSGNSFESRIKTLGKANLTDTDWVDVTDNDQSAYRFFKVTVDLP